MRLVFFVNTPEGNMVRRAHELAGHLAGRFDVDVISGPGGRDFARVRSADVVYVIDPGRRGFPAAVAAWLTRRTVVVETGDPQDALYRAQGRSRVAVLAGKAIDEVVVRRASGIVVRGGELAGVLDVRVPWVEIPDGVDVEVFRPGIEDGLRERLGIPAFALVAGVTGALQWSERAGHGYGWDIIEAVGALRELPVWGLIVGTGDGVDRLRGRADELGVSERVVFPGKVPHGDVPRYVDAMDVCVSTQTNDNVGRSRTTAKLPEYLACDRYVLATAVGGAAEVLPKEMLLPYEGVRDRAHPSRLASRLEVLIDRQTELRQGAGTRSIAVERYSYPLLAERLSSFVTELLD